MLIQIEVSTHCNYQCFYCAGRDMKQRHMPWERFMAIVSDLPAGVRTVSLQGEGEPMTHPRFWDMVSELVKRRMAPYTITNGSVIKPVEIAKWFPSIGISIDTLDPELAERIGRFKLHQVLENLDLLLEKMAPDRISIHTVYLGQPLQPLKQYLLQKGIKRHIIQPLQSKSDYVKRYGEVPAEHLGACTYRCRFLDQPVMRYFTIDGSEMPCCFIKDAAAYTSSSDLQRQLADREVPAACAGCREIYPAAIVRSRFGPQKSASDQ